MFAECLPCVTTSLAVNAHRLFAAQGGLRHLREDIGAWQGTTLGSDLAVPLHSVCCLMSLRQLL